MNNKMREHLPQIDLDKIAAIHDIETRYINGELTLEEGRAEIAQRVGTLRSYHLAFIEQTMVDHSEDECIRERMADKIKLFEGYIQNPRPEFAEDHPIMRYYQENDRMKELMELIDKKRKNNFVKNEWLGLYDEVKQYKTHYARKQNQLYTVLEKKGFTRPTEVMWTFDDMIRDIINESLRLLESEEVDEAKFLKQQDRLLYFTSDLIEKEETILYPTSCAMISAEEFEHMKEGDAEIGYAFLNIDTSRRRQQTAAAATNNATTPQNGQDFAADMQALLAKYGYSAGNSKQDEVFDVATGKLTLEQINLIYRHLPIDISYVDENELVKFYSDTDHRIFPRSKNVIGREVMNCHPKKSAHVVREVIDKLRSGEEDKAEFWINKPGVFIYIIYVAVRDAEGNFRGVLEMMQDCTRIRNMEGSRTLLVWADEEGVDYNDPASRRKAIKAKVAPAAPQTEDAAKPTNTVGTEAGATPSTATSAATTATTRYPEPDLDDDDADDAAPQIDKSSPIVITPETRLQSLLDAFPNLRQRVTEISPLFVMLRTPFGKIMAKKATVQKMSERSGIGLDRLIPALTRIVNEEAKKS